MFPNRSVTKTYRPGLYDETAAFLEETRSALLEDLRLREYLSAPFRPSVDDGGDKWKACLRFYTRLLPGRADPSHRLRCASGWRRCECRDIYVSFFGAARAFETMANDVGLLEGTRETLIRDAEGLNTLGKKWYFVSTGQRYNKLTEDPENIPL